MVDRVFARAVADVLRNSSDDEESKEEIEEESEEVGEVEESEEVEEAEEMEEVEESEEVEEAEEMEEVEESEEVEEAEEMEELEEAIVAEIRGNVPDEVDDSDEETGEVKEESAESVEESPGIESPEVEIVDDVPEEPEDLPVAQFDTTELATFTANFGGFSFKLIPQSTRSGVAWAVWVFADNVQGPLFRTKTPISRDEAEEFGIPEGLRKRINRGLRFAKDELDLPDELRQGLSERSLEDLEAMMGDGR